MQGRGRNITRARQYFRAFPKESLACLDDPDSSPDTTQMIISVERMIECNRSLDPETYISLLTRCSQAKALAQVKLIHAHALKWRCNSLELVLLNALKTYGICGALIDAKTLFDSMSPRGQFEWNSLVVGHTQNGHLEDGLSIVYKMPSYNTITWNALIVACARNGFIDEARRVFNSMPERSVMSWNAMITQYAHNGHYKQCLSLFERMELEGFRPNEITLLGLIEACCGLSSPETAKRIESRIAGTSLESNIRVCSAVVNMHGKCGSVTDARRVFDGMQNRNRITWNGMLAAYAQNGLGREAVQFFRLMIKGGVEPNRITFLSLVDACSTLSDLNEGKKAHASLQKLGFHSNAKVVSALITMYAKCGELGVAREVFDGSQRSDSITWTSMVTAYSRGGHGKEAIKLLPLMDLEGIQTDNVTFMSILDACSSVSHLKLGKLLHGLIMEEGYLDNDVHIATSLSGMYGKCGSLENARGVFESMKVKSVVSWNAIIAAHAQNGDPRGAIDLFRYMEAEGQKPNRMTCTCLLHALSHAGRLADAWCHFVSMRENYGVEHVVDHYACMADLLGRAGKVCQAEELIDTMPFEPTVVLWTSLLGACNVHKNVEIATRVSEHVRRMLPESQCGQVMLMNVLNV